MREKIETCLSMKNWAVVGATQNTSKFGNKIFKKLTQHSFNVTPINPMYDTIEGVKTVKNILDVHEKIDVISVVVSADKALLLLDDIKKTNIKYIWFQPGTYNDDVLLKAKEMELNIIHGYCVLVELGDLPFCPL